ncbi:MAG TPA: hypothetical protein VMM13_17295 [Euzebya sp.]|nr:hypothetical protein [Euzebya sp.]
MANPYATIDAYWDTPMAVCPDDEPRQLRELVRFATLAPNAHNTQSWRFVAQPGAVRLIPDFTRSLPAGDPGDRELWLSLGCALENLLLAARHVGYAPTVTSFPDGETCIDITFERTDPVTEEAPTDDALFAAIPRRHSNRSAYDGRPIPAADLDAIRGVIDEPGVSARILTDAADIAGVIEVVEAGFAWQRTNTEFKRELHSWIRFSKASILAHRDGLTSRATGRPQIPDAVGRQLVRFLSVTGLEKREIVNKIRSSSAVLVLLTDDNDRATWVRAGRSLARVKLQATARGIVCAHLNNNWQWDATRPVAQRALQLGDAHPQVAIRMGYASPLPHAPRRAVEDVLTTATPAGQ